jgi:salicylate hydroxylase
MDGTPRAYAGGAEDESSPGLEVAIVGAGIIGVITALGLLRRGMQVTIYERASKFRELGMGIGFPRVAREAMQRLNPVLLDVAGRVCQQNPQETVRYWDGFHSPTKQASDLEQAPSLFEVPERDLAFWTCVRSRFLLEMAAELPEGTTEFGKTLVDYEDREESNKVLLRFADCSTATADVGSSRPDLRDA